MLLASIDQKRYRFIPIVSVPLQKSAHQTSHPSKIYYAVSAIQNGIALLDHQVAKLDEIANVFEGCFDFRENFIVVRNSGKGFFSLAKDESRRHWSRIHVFTIHGQLEHSIDIHSQIIGTYPDDARDGLETTFVYSENGLLVLVGLRGHSRINCAPSFLATDLNTARVAVGVSALRMFLKDCEQECMEIVENFLDGQNRKHAVDIAKQLSSRTSPPSLRLLAASFLLKHGHSDYFDAKSLLEALPELSGNMLIRLLELLLNIENAAAFDNLVERIPRILPTLAKKPHLRMRLVRAYGKTERSDKTRMELLDSIRSLETEIEVKSLLLDICLYKYRFEYSKGYRVIPRQTWNLPKDKALEVEEILLQLASVEDRETRLWAIDRIARLENSNRAEREMNRILLEGDKESISAVLEAIDRPHAKALFGAVSGIFWNLDEGLVEVALDSIERMRPSESTQMKINLLQKGHRNAKTFVPFYPEWEIASTSKSIFEQACLSALRRLSPENWSTVLIIENLKGRARNPSKLEPILKFISNKNPKVWSAQIVSTLVSDAEKASGLVLSSLLHLNPWRSSREKGMKKILTDQYLDCFVKRMTAIMEVLSLLESLSSLEAESQGTTHQMSGNELAAKYSTQINRIERSLSGSWKSRFNDFIGRE